ncbi:hypothetical protein NW752_009417 [Fusarium irregulare]|uniref:Ankyrin n=1 Tax=Fusarium irregulare TaxID=2494466 RepID=A0A9W8PDN8_9HYPO|nr:hypothetical protein NW766_012695 [Fusarium irregulare]KAJ4009122.1 hypothetical protein NW752_009417 [Fusarium irregulare]
MDDNLDLLLGSRRSSPKSVEPESLEETQQCLVIRHNRSQTDQPQWKVTVGYDLIDKFHVASGEYEFTAASQAVLALEEGHEERGIALAERVPKSELFWTCVINNARKALRKVLASVHDLGWLNEVSDHFVCGKISGTWTFSARGPLGEKERKERLDHLTSRWSPASVVMFKAHKKHSSKTGNLFEVLADWIEASSHPSHNAQKLWEAGGFFNPYLCYRLVSFGVSVDRKLWTDGRTALQCAAALWQHDLIQVLIDLGANPSIRSSNGYNALHWLLEPEDTYAREDSYNYVTLTYRVSARKGNPRYEKRRIAASVKALAQFLTVDTSLSDRKTPLMLAARYSATATKVLLAERVDLEKRDEKGRTALMHFFGRGFNGRPIAILKCLLDAGADSLAVDLQNRTTLGYWADALLCNKLTNLYAGSNSLNKAFHHLASSGPLSRRTVLIEQLASVEIPLVYAARLGNAELCWALLDSGVHPEGDARHLEEAYRTEWMDLKDIGSNPVMNAMHGKAYVTAAIILAYGADVNFQVPEQKTMRRSKYRFASLGMMPLHIAIQGGGSYRGYDSYQYISLGAGGLSSCAFTVATHSDHPVERVWESGILARIEKRRQAELQEMDDNAPSSDSEYEIKKIVAANDKTKASETPFDTLFGAQFVAKNPCDPLLEAIIQEKLTKSKRQEALVKYMLRSGASVNGRSRGGVTPLFVAVSRGHLSLITLLLEHGANPNVAAIGGYTPLIVAAWDGRKDIIDALAASGANVDAQLDRIEPDKCACVQFVEWSSSTFNKCYAPLTALVVASKRGHYDAVEALISHRANINLPIEHHAHGRLLTRRESRHRWRFTFERSKSPESSDTDPEPDPQQWKGYYSVATALTWARGDVRELLLQHGADPTKEVALRQCDCQVIKERKLKSSWLDESDTE